MKKAELLTHAKNLGLNVGQRMSVESLKAMINKAELAALAGEQASDETPAPAVDETLPKIEPKVEPIVESPAIQPSPLQRYRTTSWIDLGKGQLPPETEVELTPAQAKHLLQYNGVEPL